MNKKLVRPEMRQSAIYCDNCIICSTLEISQFVKLYVEKHTRVRVTAPQGNYQFPDCYNSIVLFHDHCISVS